MLTMDHLQFLTRLGATGMLLLASSLAAGSPSGDCDSARRIGEGEGHSLYAGVLGPDACGRFHTEPRAPLVEALALRQDLIGQEAFASLPGLAEVQECRYAGQISAILADDQAAKAGCSSIPTPAIGAMP